MKILIIKLGATGDVVRTTTLLRRLEGKVTWITAEKNSSLLSNLSIPVRCLTWESRDQAKDGRYDLVINLEDTDECAAFVNEIDKTKVFGAILDKNNRLDYTDDSSEWFDLSLISRHGRKKADELKFKNNRTYQDLVFTGLGWSFQGEEYVLPTPTKTDLSGDVAISKAAGPVWPMKNWAYYDELIEKLRADGLVVNVLGKRDTLLEHYGDVAQHRCLVSGDSLPMHFALAAKVPCVSLFSCTGDWEIYDYGVQTKIVSPCLEEYFFQRGFDKRATTSISVDEVYNATVLSLGA